MKTIESTVVESVTLKRVLGFPSLFAVAIGIVIAQGCFVSILQGVGLGQGSFFIALLIAFVLTLCYVATFSELSLMMPRAGSISAYTSVAMGHFPAIIATVAGYLTPSIFAAPAELLLVEYIMDVVYPGGIAHIGLILLGIITLLNILGVEVFSSFQNIFAYTMLIALLIVGIVGVGSTESGGMSILTLKESFTQVDGNVFSLVVLALWAFMALEFVCPLIEETKNPARTIPRTMGLAALVLVVLYCIIALAGIRQVPAEQLVQSNIPHWILVQKLFGKAGAFLMAILAITATSSTINTVTATIPRMLYGMAQQNQAPEIFKKLHPRFKTPWVGILFNSTLITIPLVLLANTPNVILLLMISAATIWLVAYIIAHVDVILLRIKYPNFKRPYKTPFYPIPQLVGITGMVYAILHNAPTPELTQKVYLNALIIIGITAVYAFYWVRYRMKKKLFEAVPIEEESSDN